MPLLRFTGAPAPGLRGIRSKSNKTCSSAQFGTYAATVVHNHLLNHCKTVNAEQRNLPAVSLDDRGSDDGRPPPCPKPSTLDRVDELIGRLDTADLLADCKRRYTGVARLGVEALELKI